MRELGRPRTAVGAVRELELAAINRRSRAAASRRLNVFGVIRKTPIIEKTLMHLGPQPPPRAPAREPMPQHAG